MEDLGFLEKQGVLIQGKQGEAEMATNFYSFEFINFRIKPGLNDKGWDTTFN